MALKFKGYYTGGKIKEYVDQFGIKIDSREFFGDSIVRFALSGFYNTFEECELLSEKLGEAFKKIL